MWRPQRSGTHLFCTHEHRICGRGRCQDSKPRMLRRHSGTCCLSRERGKCQRTENWQQKSGQANSLPGSSLQAGWPQSKECKEGSTPREAHRYSIQGGNQSDGRHRLQIPGSVFPKGSLRNLPLSSYLQILYLNLSSSCSTMKETGNPDNPSCPSIFPSEIFSCSKRRFCLYPQSYTISSEHLSSGYAFQIDTLHMRTFSVKKSSCC